MNTNAPDNELADLQQISAAYREARFDDVPPAELDRAILAEAGRGSRRRLYAFLPAFAVAATVVLSVSLVLRSGMLNQSAELPTRGAVSDAPDAFAPATITVEPDSDLGPAAIPAASFDLEESAAEQRAREVAPALRQEATDTSANIQMLSAEPTALESAAFAAPFDCNGVGRDDPEAWLACIEAGAGQGLLEDARSELEAFVAAYPDYALPRTLEPLLDQ